MLGLIDARPKLGYFFTGNKEKDLLSRVITDISVESCLSQPVIVGEHTSAYDAVIAMFTEDVGTVFVGTDNILAGVVSLVAAQRLMEYEVDCLPVVNIINRDEEDHKELQIVGRISKTNITRLFVECGLGRRS